MTEKPKPTSDEKYAFGIWNASAVAITSSMMDTAVDTLSDPEMAMYAAMAHFGLEPFEIAHSDIFRAYAYGCGYESPNDFRDAIKADVRTALLPYAAKLTAFYGDASTPEASAKVIANGHRGLKDSEESEEDEYHPAPPPAEPPF